MSRKVYRNVQDKFEFPIVALGRQELKNVQMPIQVYRIVLPWEMKEEALESVLDRRRIAVLPLVNMISGSADEYFADGMTEELISTISNIGELSVISRTSAMKFKGGGRTVAEIGSELRAGTLLEGSVRKSENRIRIAVQLIDVIDDKHLWAQSYDRELDDVFAVQSDIAKQVADALRVRVLPTETRQIEKRPTKSTEAYTLYLKGRYYWNERSKEGLLRAIEYFKHAIEMDPEYALAYSGIADYYSVLGDHRYIPYLEAFTKSKENALRAVQYDDSSAEAHTSLASAFYQLDYDWKGAEREFKKALELNPNYATGHHWYGIMLMRTGRLEEALREGLLATKLDPLSPMIAVFCGIVYATMMNYDLAEQQVKEALEINPDLVPGHLCLSWFCLQQGKYAEAEREAHEVLRLVNDHPTYRAWLAAVSAYAGNKEEARKILDELRRTPGIVHISTNMGAYAYVGLGEKERAIETIEKAYDERADWLPQIVSDPLLESVRSEPRVVAVLKKIGLGS